MAAIVISSGGDHYGPFEDVDAAVAWAEANEEDLGDWHIPELYPPN